jgi:hypothetical protein
MLSTHVVDMCMHVCGVVLECMHWQVQLFHTIIHQLVVIERIYACCVLHAAHMMAEKCTPTTTEHPTVCCFCSACMFNNLLNMPSDGIVSKSATLMCRHLNMSATMLCRHISGTFPALLQPSICPAQVSHHSADGPSSGDFKFHWNTVLTRRRLGQPWSPFELHCTERLRPSGSVIGNW